MSRSRSNQLFVNDYAILTHFVTSKTRISFIVILNHARTFHLMWASTNLMLKGQGQVKVNQCFLAKKGNNRFLFIHYIVLVRCFKKYLFQNKLCYVSIIS